MANSRLDTLPRDILFFLLVEEHPLDWLELRTNCPQLELIGQTDGFQVVASKKWTPILVSSLRLSEETWLIGMASFCVLQNWEQVRHHAEGINIINIVAFLFRTDHLNAIRWLFRRTTVLMPSYLESGDMSIGTFYDPAFRPEESRQLMQLLVKAGLVSKRHLFKYAQSRGLTQMAQDLLELYGSSYIPPSDQYEPDWAARTFG